MTGKDGNRGGSIARGNIQRISYTPQVRGTAFARLAHASLSGECSYLVLCTVTECMYFTWQDVCSFGDPDGASPADSYTAVCFWCQQDTTGWRKRKASVVTCGTSKASRYIGTSLTSRPSHSSQ